MTLLYHYTSLQTFLLIVKHKSIRFSELSKSNDRMEGKFIHQCLALELQRMNKPMMARFMILNQLENIINLYPHFGFCMTSAVDDLGQWRAYANNGQGVAIGFNIDRLEACARSSPLGASTRVSRVRYGEDEVRKHMGEIFKILETIDDEYFYSLEGRKGFEGLSAPSNISSLFEAIGKFYGNCHDIKNRSFINESETRITQDSDSALGSTLGEKLEFSARQSRIVQHYQVEIEPECIEHIMVGPDFEGSESEISRVLSTWKKEMWRAAVTRSISSARAF